MRGLIGVVSHEGQGSRFWVTLRLGHAAPASLAALRQKAERFDTVIDPAQIAEVALGYQA